MEVKEKLIVVAGNQPWLVQPSHVGARKAGRRVMVILLGEEGICRDLWCPLQGGGTSSDDGRYSCAAPRILLIQLEFFGVLRG